MTDYIAIEDLNKSFLLSESNTFCIIPWLHIHMTPEGTTLPCCVSDAEFKHAIPHDDDVNTSINSEFMKQLRTKMLNGETSGVCKSCYSGEQSHGGSFRKEANQQYQHRFDEVLSNTRTDGYLENFHMRYFDIRFSNICNMKCRSCNSGYSSQWEVEDLKTGQIGASINKNNSNKLMHSLFEHLPFLDRAYFAGGEPLVTDEHYIILQELIDKGRTNIDLVYNTNISNLKFKNHDIMSYWEQFDKNINLFASIDHYGMKAEYIRTGTNWNKIEENIKTLKQTPNTHLGFTTTITNLNVVTLGDFFVYMYDKGLWPDGFWQLNPVFNPGYYSPWNLPEELKQQAVHNIMTAVEHLTGNVDPAVIDGFTNFANSLHSHGDWHSHADQFKTETLRLDNLRNNDFTMVFPELQELIK